MIRIRTIECSRLVLGTLIVFVGCTATYQSHPTLRSPAKLAAGKRVLIATPANGSYEGRSYASSGLLTAGALRAAFRRAGAPAEISPECGELGCLETAAGEADYLVVPAILRWEDRATEWPGQSDRIEIAVRVFARDGTEIASTTVTGKSKWATLGGDHPEDLLAEPLGSFVASLY